MGTGHLTTFTGLSKATTEEQKKDIMAGASDAELKEVGMNTILCGNSRFSSGLEHKVKQIQHFIRKIDYKKNRIRYMRAPHLFFFSLKDWFKISNFLSLGFIVYVHIYKLMW